MSVLKPHVSLNVGDIAKSVDFYEKVFGVSAVKRRPGYAKFDLSEPSLNLTMQVAPRTGINANHFGVQCETSADVEAARRRLENAGLIARSETDVACCYAVQDKVWVEDPDGNAWEYFVVKGEASVMSRSQATTTAPCCAPECCTETAVER
jgi:catechol 2,3-dioxygenase-like lactoylglutathione lyase family enzyme